MLNKFLREKEIVLWNIFRDNVNGHIFECLDYYLLFKSNGYNTGIVFIYDDITIDDIRDLIEDKYDFTSGEINDIIDDIHMEDISTFLKRKVVDGTSTKYNIFVEAHDLTRLYYKYSGRHTAYALNNLIGLRCSDVPDEFKVLADTTNLDILIFQDFRIYGEEFFWKTRFHKKRINFLAYKPVEKFENNRALIYLSTEVRGTTSEYLKNLVEYYPKMEKFYITVMNPTKYQVDDDRVEFVVPPVKDLFNKFDTLIYIPISRQFDCSPRLITECVFYNKKICFYETGKSYQENDRGLYWRWKDCQNDFPDLILTEKDELFEYVRNCEK